MRCLLALSAVGLLATTVALAGDPPPKHDLIYRWDQLDNKTAVYDTEVTSTVIAQRTAKADTSPSDGVGAEDSAGLVEGVTTTKQRLSMRFARGERGRGLVTITNGRFQIAVASKADGQTQSLAYDSENPPAAGPDERIKSQVSALLALVGNPYTLTVTRRGVVEKVEGRAASELPKFRGTFLLLPEVSKAVGEKWPSVTRHPTQPFGDLVERATYTLSKVNERGEAMIDEVIATELDDTDAHLPSGAAAHVGNPFGKGHVALDARGLKLEEETEQGYEFDVSESSESVEQKTKLVSVFKWKLVEVKDD
jgi:hypothetical protein